jgi:hypothetical protein
LYKGGIPIERRPDFKRYRKLFKEWITWAVWNDITLDGLNDLPSAQWYLWRSKMKKWTARHLRIGYVGKGTPLALE